MNGDSDRDPSTAGALPAAANDEAMLAQARAWARRLAVGRPTAADAEALRRWCAQSAAHAQTWRRASAEWRQMGQVLQAARQRHPEAPIARTAVPARRLFLGAATATAAGAVALVWPPLGLWPSLPELGADYRTAAGQQLDVELDPHARLFLNTQTSVAVRRSMPMRIRLIAGEAEIRSDGAVPLEVDAGSGRIRLAVGCIEVRHLSSEATRVVCSEGTAQLSHAGQVLVLEAEQSVAYDGNGVSAPVRRHVAGASAWRQGYVVFDDTPLADAVEEINRYRRGRVVLLDGRLAGRRISGRFTIRNIDQALALIRQLYGVPARQLGDVVLLG
ncbi:FecR family protein [Pigmentiphaga soli]|uniref:FecR family protein n=1 Tax=Pigmentiphaga soli TaxID=1007095 RepID=A0ABP8HPK3_9BURK